MLFGENVDIFVVLHVLLPPLLFLFFVLFVFCFSFLLLLVVYYYLFIFTLSVSSDLFLSDVDMLVTSVLTYVVKSTHVTPEIKIDKTYIYTYAIVDLQRVV